MCVLHDIVFCRSLSTSPVEEKGRHPGQLSIRPHRSSDGVKQNTYLKQSVVYIDNKDVPTHLKDLCKMPEYRDKNFRGFITTKVSVHYVITCIVFDQIHEQNALQIGSWKNIKESVLISIHQNVFF